MMPDGAWDYIRLIFRLAYCCIIPLLDSYTESYNFIMCRRCEVSATTGRRMPFAAPFGVMKRSVGE